MLAPTGSSVASSALAASAVRAPLDRFRCVPYSAVITAATCVARQKAAGIQEGQVGSPIGMRWRSEGKIGDYGGCRRCDVGPRIRKAVAS